MAAAQAKAYIFGIPRIDEQHTQFFDLIQTLKKFIDESQNGYQPNQLLSLILRFRSYAFYHFHTEEMMMFEKKYPGFFAQKDAHNKFLFEVIAYEEKFETAYKALGKSESDDSTDGLTEATGDRLQLAGEMNEFIMQWYHQHILEMDKGYVDYLK